MGPADQAMSREELPTFPMTRCPGFDPPPEYGRFRVERPVTIVRLRHDQQAWLVTRYVDIRRVLSDPVRFSSDPSRAGFPQLRPVVDRAARAGSFLVTDPPLHTRYRRILATEFTAAKAEALRPDIERITDACLDAALAGQQPADLFEAYALPVPVQVIAQVLGVPLADQEFFTSRSRSHLNRSLAADQVQSALDELEAYLDALITDRVKTPGGDLLSRLAVRRLDTGELTQDELVGMTVLLLVGGVETTANMTALSVLALLDHPDQWAELAANPSQVAGAVEELLRYLGVVQHGVVRAVTEDVELGGQRIRAGEGLILALSSANRDPVAFPDADRLDIRRDARGQLVFGWGVHQCIGQHLARVELQVALERLVRRLPRLRLALPAEELVFHMDSPFYSVRPLPVAW